MNYTKEDMENFASYAIKHEDLFYHTDLLEMWDKENNTASRDSSTLSAVPNEEEIDKWYVDSVGLIKRGGNYVWNYSLGYQTHGDQVNMLYDFANWIKQRGIAE